MFNSTQAYSCGQPICCAPQQSVFDFWSDNLRFDELNSVVAGKTGRTVDSVDLSLARSEGDTRRALLVFRCVLMMLDGIAPRYSGLIKFAGEDRLPGADLTSRDFVLLDLVWLRLLQGHEIDLGQLVRTAMECEVDNGAKARELLGVDGFLSIGCLVVQDRQVAKIERSARSFIRGDIERLKALLPARTPGRAKTARDRALRLYACRLGSDWDQRYQAYCWQGRGTTARGTYVKQTRKVAKMLGFDGLTPIPRGRSGGVGHGVGHRPVGPVVAGGVLLPFGERESTSNAILSIDPGARGGLALIADGCLVRAWDMPMSRKGHLVELDLERMSEIVTVARDYQAQIVIEDVAVYSGAAHSDVATKPDVAFAFGQYFGLVRASFELSGLPVALIAPAVWHKTLGVDRTRSGKVEKLRELVPGADVHGLKDGQVDAALLGCSYRLSENACRE